MTIQDNRTEKLAQIKEEILNLKESPLFPERINQLSIMYLIFVMTNYLISLSFQTFQARLYRTLQQGKEPLSVHG